MKLGHLLLAGVLLAGCEPTDSRDRPVSPMTIQAAKPRFEVTRVQTFQDSLAYNSERGIYLVRDTKTGAEYFGVSGVGITELGSHSSGKSRHSDER